MQIHIKTTGKWRGHMWVTWLTHVHIVAVLHLPQRMDISILWNVLELGWVSKCIGLTNHPLLHVIMMTNPQTSLWERTTQKGKTLPKCCRICSFLCSTKPCFVIHLVCLLKDDDKSSCLLTKPAGKRYHKRKFFGNNYQSFRKVLPSVVMPRLSWVITSIKGNPKEWKECRAKLSV